MLFYQKKICLRISCFFFYENFFRQKLTILSLKKNLYPNIFLCIQKDIKIMSEK
jgi:hypothetical protein